LKKYDEALEDINLLIELEPKNKEFLKYKENISKIREKYQKEQTEEMVTQLKDLGNKFLGLFGLSTDNFQFNQNENGGYSVNFDQKK
jgi:hypothetical protein